MPTNLIDPPLSSIDGVPCTPSTRAALVLSGVAEATIDRLSELGGQSLLALRTALEDEEVDAPVCHQRAYDPAAPLCGGCVFMPGCWRRDVGYLGRLGAGEAAPPPGVPAEVVADRVRHGAAVPKVAPPPPKVAAPTPARVPPPPPARRPPPPPPPKAAT